MRKSVSGGYARLIANLVVGFLLIVGNQVCRAEGGLQIHDLHKMTHFLLKIHSMMGHTYTGRLILQPLFSISVVEQL